MTSERPNLTARDTVVRTGNPEALDATMQQLGAVVIEGSWDGDTCVVRALGDVGFVRFAIQSQGYGEIVQEGHDD